MTLVISGSVALAVPFSTLSAWLSYRQESVRQQEQVDAVISLFGLQLRKALWDFDETTVREILAGLRHFPALQSVEVVSPDLRESYLKPGTQLAQAGPMQSYTLRAPEGQMVLGELRLRVDRAALDRQLREHIDRAIAVSAVALMLLALLLLVLLKRSFTIPVLALSRHVQNMTPERLADPAPVPQGSRRNELNDLAEGITRLQHALAAQLEQRDAIARTLKQSEQRLQLMADSIPNQLWTAQPNGALDYASQRALAYFGSSLERLLLAGWSGLVHRDDLPECLARWTRACATGEPYQMDLRLRRADGVYLWHDTMAVAQRDEQQRVVKWFGSSTDITERKRSQEELLQSQKMNAIGQLAGGIAHDFNNQLTAIFGFAELLNARTNDATSHKLAAGILLSASRCRDLTRNLLAFSRKQQLQSVMVDVHHLVDETIQLLERSIDKRITIVRRFQASSSVVRGDPTQLQNMLLNLALNARDAMPAGGRVTFSSELLDTRETARTPSDDRLSALGLGPGCYLCVSINDTGSGMSDEVKAHLFEPFFTTKPLGRGTGMGLPSVYGTVKSHHGAVAVDSVIDQGTTFRVYLPLADQQVEQGLSGRQEARTARLQVLVVDDERLLRELLGEILREWGHATILTASGEEALEVYARSAHEIDLVILDLMMPGLGGLEALRILRSLNPKVRVLVTSGFGAQGEIEQALAQGAHGFLQKPYEQRQLQAAIDQVVAETA